ncbi:MAG: hypothetical protein EZS28_033930 [Streblomastix strix]|uniref:SH3 domain-containing protein n=1 Tax=Streblomastix strix TaxID=222440 RepID=A0A5J4ULF2_9EUKA|nr:MAG: hypothetical protein EZS28_033930 [Streblomastix strix]
MCVQLNQETELRNILNQVLQTQPVAEYQELVDKALAFLDQQGSAQPQQQEPAYEEPAPEPAPEPQYQPEPEPEPTYQPPEPSYQPAYQPPQPAYQPPVQTQAPAAKGPKKSWLEPKPAPKPTQTEPALDNEYFEVIADYTGKDGDPQFIAVKKGEVVKVVKKELVYVTIEKDGQVGKVPKGKLKVAAGRK